MHLSFHTSVLVALTTWSATAIQAKDVEPKTEATVLAASRGM
jgi:hypothetical protein